MQGKNKIYFNKPTINEALQYYLKEKVLRKEVELKVVDVRISDDIFVIETESEGNEDEE